MTINIYGVVSLVVFFAIILLVGILASRLKRRNKSPDNPEDEDHMLAGRSLGIFIGVFSMAATWIDGGYINGTAETIYTQGLLWCQGPIGYSLALTFGGLVFAKKIREKNFVTMLDPVQEKYGNLVGAIMYLPLVLNDTLYLASIFLTLGSTVIVMAGIPPTYAVIGSAYTALLYTLVGGMYSVSYTDIVSIFAIMFGLCLSMPYCISNKATESLVATSADWMGSVDRDHILIYIDNFAMLIIGGCTYQTYYQRVLSCPSAKVAQRMSCAATIVCLLVAIPPIVIGIVAKSTVWTKTEYTGPVDPATVLPMVFRYLTPTAVSFVGLGIIAGAVMSASDATMLGSGSMFARNVYKRNIRPKASNREVLWVMRAAMLVIATTGAVISLNTNSISAVWYLIGDFAYVFFFPQMFGLIWLDPYCNAYGAFVSIVATVILRILSGAPPIGIPSIIKFPWYDHGNDVQLFPFKTFLVCLCLALLTGVSALMKFVFTHGILPENFDVFRCIVKQKNETQEIQIHRINASNGIDNTAFAKEETIPKLSVISKSQDLIC